MLQPAAPDEEDCEERSRPSYWIRHYEDLRSHCGKGIEFKASTITFS